MPDTVRIHVRDIHWRDYDYYHTLSSFGTPINFRIWAEQQVYGGITAIHHHQVANHCVQRYHPEPGKRRIDCTVATRTVELELVDPIPGEYRVEAIMGAEIEWSGLLGIRYPFQDSQWPDILPRDAIIIFICPGFHPRLVLIPPLK